MMKNDNFKSLVFGPKCTGPKSIGPKYFRAEVVSGAEVFSGRSISGPKYFPGRSIHRAEVVSGRSISGPKCFGPKYFRAEVSVGPKLSPGQTGCEPNPSPPTQGPVPTALHCWKISRHQHLKERDDKKGRDHASL